MPDLPDDMPKELLDLIQKLIHGNIGPSDNAGMPSIVGVKFVVGGNGVPKKMPTAGKPKTLTLEVLNENTHYTIQTELPGDCSDKYSLEYPEGKLRLIAGNNHEYSAEVPLSNIDPTKTKEHLKNGVLEVICYKKQEL